MAGPATATDHLDRIATDLAAITTHLPAARRAIRAALPGARSTPTDTGGSRTSTEPGDAIHQAALAQTTDAAITADRAITTHLVHILAGWAPTPPRPATPTRPARPANPTRPGLQTLAWTHAGPLGATPNSAPILERITIAHHALAAAIPATQLDRRAWTELATDLARIEREAQALATTCTTWARTATAHTAADIWCQHCERHGDHHVHDRHRVAGMTVCAWAYTWHRNHGTLPSKAEVDAHSTGKRPGRRVADSRKVVA